MKKGKTTKLNIFDDAKCHYGTVDSKNLKSIYIVLQTWVEPIDEYDNWSKITGEIKRQILHTMLESVDYTTFEKKHIVDLDLRTSGIQKNKRSFEFKSLILRKKIKDIVQSLHKDDLKNSRYFTLSRTKMKETVTI